MSNGTGNANSISRDVNYCGSLSTLGKMFLYSVPVGCVIGIILGVKEAATERCDSLGERLITLTMYPVMGAVFGTLGAPVLLLMSPIVIPTYAYYHIQERNRIDRINKMFNRD